MVVFPNEFPLKEKGESITAIEELKMPPVAESKSLLSSGGNPSPEVFASMQNGSHGSRRKVRCREKVCGHNRAFQRGWMFERGVGL